MQTEKLARLLAALLAGLAAMAAITLLILGRTSRPRMVEVLPGNGGSGVAITTPIRVVFSHEMEASSVESRFSIAPETEGAFRWTGSALTFVPRVALAPGAEYTVMLEPGAVSRRGRVLETRHTWSFRTRTPDLLFLGLPSLETQGRQLFASDAPASQAPRQLTDQLWGLWDYAVHPQGEWIVYSALREDGGTDLWRMDRDGANQELLLACPDEACLNPAWSPGGDLIAYERRGIWAGAPNLDPQVGRLWILEWEDGRTHALLDYDVPLHSPVWDPEGSRLAYVSPLLPGIEIVDLQSGEVQAFGNEWGTAPVWSPEGDSLVVPDLALAGEALVVRLMRIDLDSGDVIDLSGEEPGTKDTAPAWSPDGTWIALARQRLGGGGWTAGRQIWLMRTDGTEDHLLVSDPAADQFGLTWRPDGAALAYLSADLSEGPQPVPRVSVWVYDVASNESMLIVSQAVLPRWLP